MRRLRSPLSWAMRLSKNGVTSSAERRPCLAPAYCLQDRGLDFGRRYFLRGGTGTVTDQPAGQTQLLLGAPDRDDFGRRVTA